MSDNESSDNKVKPTIFYAQKSQEDKPKWAKDKRNSNDGKTDKRGRYDKPSSNKPRSDKSRSDNARTDDSRIETFGRASYGRPSSDKPRSDRPRSDNSRSNNDKNESFGRGSYGKSSSDKPWSDKPRSEKFRNESRHSNDSNITTFKPRSRKDDIDDAASPWKSRFQNTEQLPTFDNEPKPSIEHEKIKRQRKEETFVYSENSCKAIFTHRPESIIKAFLIQEKTYEFKALIAYLVEHRLGYDVISDEQMTKITQTPHHGGICLIVKKRQPLLVGDYLVKSAKLADDCILAIDDIDNPHNLGGIARTAAFFGVNGLLLRQPDLLDNGAALRVSEGGAESIMPIKADDFLASIDLFKQHGYRIVALLPNNVKQSQASKLATLAHNKKTLFVVFQQINSHITALADNVVYLSGSEAMPALNISVLTGILLAKWQEIQSEK